MYVQSSNGRPFLYGDRFKKNYNARDGNVYVQGSNGRPFLYGDRFKKTTTRGMGMCTCRVPMGDLFCMAFDELLVQKFPHVAHEQSYPMGDFFYDTIPTAVIFMFCL